MYNIYSTYPCACHNNMLMYSPCKSCPYPYYSNFLKQFPNQSIPYADQLENTLIELKDYGPEALVFNINKASKQNNAYRRALWTGKHLQLTLMSINVGEDIGLEMHPNVDQFIRIEQGQGLVKMGDSRNDLNFQRNVYDDFAIIIPAGKWHNLINTGHKSLKLYSIYAPPQHPHSTIHETKASAEAAEGKGH